MQRGLHEGAAQAPGMWAQFGRGAGLHAEATAITGNRRRADLPPGRHARLCGRAAERSGTRCRRDGGRGNNRAGRVGSAGVGVVQGRALGGLERWCAGGTSARRAARHRHRATTAI